MSTFLTVAIPYVNAEPHLGYAYELVEADLAARGRRSAGESVRFLGGTDDYSLKNALAAEAAGEQTRAFVDRRGDRFVALADALGIGFDDFIRTSSDPRHRPAVERLWNRCLANGDLDRRDYEGSYCVGCEQFYEPRELVGGRCPEHRRPLESVVEVNWFFRLSRYADRLVELIRRGELLVEPAPFRREILSFLRAGVRDISVSRSVERAHGWGIPVPGDPSQVIYVWFDALTNYIASLGYGDDHPDHDRWWRATDHRIHVVGKGITRFHAVYWPAFLLSAGEPLPTRVHVHPYLTVGGHKLSKSGGGGDSPFELVDRLGADAIRWWVASDVGTTSDTDFTVDRLAERVDDDLANGVGNLVNRVTTLCHRATTDPRAHADRAPLEFVSGLRLAVVDALGAFDRQGASRRITRAVAELNRHVEHAAPWTLLGEPDECGELDRLLGTYVASLGEVAAALVPLVPDLARRIDLQLVPGSSPEPVRERICGRPAAARSSADASRAAAASTSTLRRGCPSR